MILIKENIKKKRKVYKIKNFYRKVWLYHDLKKLESHVNDLECVIPNYVISYDHDETTMWIDLKEINGVPANTLPITNTLKERIIDFCLDNIENTYPYSHGDWVLSNILINDNDIHLVDWDNLSIRSKKESLNKLIKDLTHSFNSIK
jgi:RIO-like serine/threonine protein kinase